MAKPFFVLLLALYFSGIAFAYAQTQATGLADTDAVAAVPGSSASSAEASEAASSLQQEDAEASLEQRILRDSYEVVTDEIESFKAAKQQASTAAKSLGRTLSLYIKEKRMQKRQQELIHRFQLAFSDLAKSLNLNENEREHLLMEVEEVYIEDAESGKNELDQHNFRDLPDIVQQKYAEIELLRTEDGTVDTYYSSGAVKTRWLLKKGKPHGAIVTYYENGEMLYIDIYENGKKMNRKKYNEEGKLEFEQDYSYSLNQQEQVNKRVREDANSADLRVDTSPAAQPTGGER